MASTKDRLETLERKLQGNRHQMTKQAKKAAKLEKMLKLLTGGYQSRAASLSKQLNDGHEQAEQAYMEMNTFKHLQQFEGNAIPKRMEVDILEYFIRYKNVIVYLTPRGESCRGRT